MREIQYDRKKAVAYAKTWAEARNPKYLNFDRLGGDCTNFASQCVYAGCGVMNYKPVTGWFYTDSVQRTASWTGVEFFGKFLLENSGVGPYGHEVDEQEITIGDIVQLGDSKGHFFHSPVVCEVTNGQIFVAAHTFDRYRYPLDDYFYDVLRCIHIDGARV